ncbi:uncharacterized protein LOC128265711 [Drosophila gunungcola]|uniref:uncharacterized protein LOC128265711 n=1 Tax=Drosophila gunungcola TaxID=103775 RepID=UPI0022E15CB6|nr:uncharacterized protein LOC128265711 [Drosophila gunungcola]
MVIMYNIKSPLPEMLSFENNTEMENSDGADNLATHSTVELRADAPEFVPISKMKPSTNNEDDVDFNELKKMFEALDEEKAQGIPWEGFPQSTEIPSSGAEVVLSNDVDNISVSLSINEDRSMENPTQISVFTTPSSVSLDSPPPVARRLVSKEMRREQKRIRAVDALNLAEQRRMWGHLVTCPEQGDENSEPAPSRSPIRFKPEKIVQVDRFRAAKREQIEKALLEIANELEEQERENREPIEPWTPNESEQSATMMEQPKKMTKMEDQPAEAWKTNQETNSMSLSSPVDGEKRTGDLTCFQQMNNQNPFNDKIVQRYSIKQLLDLKSQSEELKDPNVIQILKQFGLLSH